MTGHLTDNILELLRMKKLPAHELMVVDDHLATCELCRELLGTNFSAAGTAERFERAVLHPTDHLDYEKLESFVDDRLSVDERATVARHVENCGECADELRALQEFAGRRPGAVAPTRVGLLTSLTSFFMRPVPIFASIVVVLAIGSGIWLTRTQPDFAQVANTSDVATAPPEPESETAVNVPVENAPVKLAVSINDGGETVGISKDGELSGYVSVRANYRALVTKALGDERLTIADIRDLKGPAGVLMGDPSVTGTFRIHSPVGKVVASDTPTFTWQAVAGAEQYVVDVFDQDYNKVASSGEIRTTSWRSKLPRGRTYTWQVTAVSDGKIFKAPQRPLPDAKFRIVDGRTAEELAALRRNNPRYHLLLGVAYANAGLIDEAIRELEAVAKQNPRSELPRRLIRQLRQAR